MNEILVQPDGITREALSFFKENAEKVKPVKDITVFFDTQNFIFTELNVATRGITMIIRGENGNEMHLAGVNCGYGGEGPHGAKQILKKLNIAEEDANQVLLSRGVKYKFNNEKYTNKQSYICVPNMGVHFHSFNEDKSWSEYDFEKFQINAFSRKIFCTNPQMKKMKELLWLIDYGTPLKLKYYFGSNSPFENYYRADISDVANLTEIENYDASSVNLVIETEKYVINCLISPRYLGTVVNVIKMNFSGESFINTNRYGEIELSILNQKSELPKEEKGLMKAWEFSKLLFKLFFNNIKQEEISGEILLKKSKKGKRL